MTDINQLIGKKVRILSGEFTGYYGEVLEVVDPETVLVSHNVETFEGHKVNIVDVTVDE